jgi:acyl-CoA hydrolase
VETSLVATQVITGQKAAQVPDSGLEDIDRVDSSRTKINLHRSVKCVLELVFEAHDPKIVEIVYQTSSPATKAVLRPS